MKSSGRVHWLTLICIVGAVVVLFLLTLGSETPEQVVNKFFKGLATGDSKLLSEVTFLDGATPQQTETAWKKTVTETVPYFRFIWRVTATSTVAPDKASVDIMITKKAGDPASYEEKYGIPLEKRDGKWKVLVRDLDREMFPGLPR